MAISRVDVGSFWQPQWTFKVGSTPTDPTTLVVRHRYEQDGVLSAATTITENTPASLTSTSQPVSRISAGVYRLNLLIAERGHYWAKAEGTGAVVDAEQAEAVADPDAFTDDFGLAAHALVGLGETKDWLNSHNVTQTDDAEVVRAINDISARFADVAQREFKAKGTNPQTRTFYVDQRGPRDPYYIDGEYMGERSAFNRRVLVGDMASAPTAVSIIDEDWTTVVETPALADITAHRDWRDPVNGPIRWLEFQTDVASLAVGMRVNVTGSFGFPSVPGSVRQAVLDAIVETLDRDVEHYSTDIGAVQAAGEGGNVVVVGNAGPRVVSLPPRALAVAWSYRDVAVG